MPIALVDRIGVSRQDGMNITLRSSAIYRLRTFFI